MPKTTADRKQKLLDNRAKIDQQIRTLEAEEKAKAKEAHAAHLMALARVLDDLGYGTMTPEELRGYLQQERRLGILGNPEDADLPLLEEDPSPVEAVSVESPTQPSSISNGWFRTREVR